MKVAFISQPFDTFVPRLQSSVGLWTAEVAQVLSATCGVVVYARKNRRQRQVRYPDTVQYRFIPALHHRLGRACFLPVRRWLPVRRPYYATTLFGLDYAGQVAYSLRQQPCDIVHIHNFTQFVPIVRALNPAVKIVLHMHCEWLTQLDAALMHQRLQMTDFILGCSDYITAKIRQRFPQHAERCYTVFNGVNVRQFCRPSPSSPVPVSRAPRLLFVGRVSPEKGVHVLLEAFQRVVALYPEAQLDIVGAISPLPREFLVALSDNGPAAGLAAFYQEDYLLALQRLVPERAAKQVRFIGAVPHEQIAAYYYDADVLINPSLSEAFGMSLIEAMASECPVVASRIGGMPDIVTHGTTGLLVEPGNAAALTDALLSLLGNATLRRSLGQAGRQRACSLFSWEEIGRTMRYYYQQLCGSRPYTAAPH